MTIGDNGCSSWRPISSLSNILGKLSVCVTICRLLGGEYLGDDIIASIFLGSLRDSKGTLSDDENEMLLNDVFVDIEVSITLLINV